MNKKQLFGQRDSFQETRVNENYKNLSFTIILVQPEHSGNIGSIARVMRNFDFFNLVVFNPIEREEHILSYETRGFAMHGKEILLNSEIVEIGPPKYHTSELKNYLKKFDLIIATTASGMRYTNLRRLTIFPEDFSLPLSKKPLNIAILFGKESRGLTNEEISLADILLRIPASNTYPTLNLSHAVGIILYELYKKINIINIGRGNKPVLLANKQDRLIIYKIIRNLIKQIKVRTHKKEKVFYAFKNVFERAIMSKKELSFILGLFSKLNSIMNHLNMEKKKKKF